MLCLNVTSQVNMECGKSVGSYIHCHKEQILENSLPGLCHQCREDHLRVLNAIINLTCFIRLQQKLWWHGASYFRRTKRSPFIFKEDIFRHLRNKEEPLSAKLRISFNSRLLVLLSSPQTTLSQLELNPTGSLFVGYTNLCLTHFILFFFQLFLETTGSQSGGMIPKTSFINKMITNICDTDSP